MSEFINTKTKDEEKINDIPIVIEEASSSDETVNKLTTSNETNALTTESSSSTLTLVTMERRRRHPLPYTFHYIHGKNIKLCSSGKNALDFIFVSCIVSYYKFISTTLTW